MLLFRFKISRLYEKFINSYSEEGLGTAFRKSAKKISRKILDSSWGRISRLRAKVKSIVVKKLSELVLETEAEETLEEYKQLFLSQYRCKLQGFLLSQKNLDFSINTSPLISIILVLYNKAELTLECLNSLYKADGIELCEIIIVDNNSTDETSEVLSRLKGVKIIRNPVNLHFLLASNQAAAEAEGKYILFLNNDTQVLPATITAALKAIEAEENIGAVGGKIILLDGTLQEAGSIIWQDGSCLGYGRGDDPFAPMYMYKRDVDYCSGAFLLTHRELFLEMGCFDISYQPAYYEETDYCLKLWEKGKKVIYDPDTILLHFEFASSSSNERAIELQLANRQKFVQQHESQLSKHFLPSPDKIPLARQTSNKNSCRVLFIEDRIPYAHLGSGFPRTQEMLLAMVEKNYLVTFYPLQDMETDWMGIYSTMPKSIEVMANYGVPRLEEFLEARKNYYHIILVSRPHNMRILKPILERNPEWFTQTKIVYDAEALYSYRDMLQRSITGKKITDWYVEEEVGLLKAGDCILSVSEGEREKLLQNGVKNVEILSHSLALELTENSFEERQNLLFVGSIHTEDSPNGDAIVWFAEKIFPEIKQRLNREIKLLVVGVNNSEKLANIAKQDQDIELVGKVEDLEPYYNQARIFIAPTRFAAGIPLKVLHAAAAGLPIVTTALIASQLDWQQEEDLLVGDEPSSFAQQCIRLYEDPELWEKLRNNAALHIKNEYSRESLVGKLDQILSQMYTSLRL